MSKHKKHRTTRPSSRREQFQPTAARRARMSPTTAVMGITAVLAAVLVYLIASSTGNARAAATEIGTAGGDVTLPIAAFADGQARFYRYVTAAGREVKFFVLRSSDGVVRAAFDACDTCYSKRKGYHQEGDAMMCHNCGRRFPSVSVNVLQGGCNPAPLERMVVGDQLLVKAASLEQGTVYF